jgi:5-(hydroxymethyl)furfural/furfural oxidase
MLTLVINKSSWHGLRGAVAGLGVCLQRPFSRGAVRLASADPDVPPDVSFRMLADVRDQKRMVDGSRLAIERKRDERIAPCATSSLPPATPGSCAGSTSQTA